MSSTKHFSARDFIHYSNLYSSLFEQREPLAAEHRAAWLEQREQQWRGGPFEGVLQQVELTIAQGAAARREGGLSRGTATG